MSFTNISNKIDQKIEAMNYQSKTTRTTRKKRLLTIAGVILVVVLILGFAALQIFFAGKNLKSHGMALNEAYKNQNFDQMQTELKQVKSSVDTINLYSYVFIWTRVIPFVGGYFADAQHFSQAASQELKAATEVLNILSPHQKELGFDGTPVAGQDRIAQGMKILEKLLPEIDRIQPYLQAASDDVQSIDTDKYPEKFRGMRVKDLVSSGKELIMGLNTVVKDNKSALDLLPGALGVDSPKNYLLLFQNDKEIRATGGFLTAYANLSLDKGQLNTDTSDDIYRLDEQLLKVCLNKICPLTPPAPIIKYLPEFDGKPRKAWSMRDSNLSPDVPTSAKQFETMYSMLGKGLPFDGIIYIDTQVVEEILKVIGPIEVLGTTYSAENDSRCNCPNIIYELEHYAEVAAKGEEDRKAILGVLMQQIMARALGADVEKLPILAETVVRLANDKHIIFYMHDAKLQQALSGLGWTGEIVAFDGDYLHVNDSNFAGGKSNLYVDQIVTQEIKTGQDGKTVKKLTIEYKNPQPFNIWLNGINRDYVRIYVPKGSKLITSKGSNQKVNTTEELNKTVFDAFITVNPQNSRVLSFEYEIPYNPSNEYKLLIQKQPGAKDFLYKVNINGKRQPEFDLDRDIELDFKI